MTINSAQNKTIAIGNGSQTQFAFGFVGVAAAYIGVIFTDASGNETVLSHGSGATQYQITLNSPVPGALWGIGGTVTYDPSGTPIAAGTSLTIFRTLPLTQAVSLQNQISLSELGNGAETGLDTLEMQLQQISENISRAITAPIVDPSTINLILPPAAQRANTGLAFDGSGNVIAGTTPATGLISTAMRPVVDAATLAVGRAAFGLGTMATEGIGSGLIDDGAGNARVNNPITQVATNQTVTAAFDLERFIAAGPINFSLPRANTLWNGFGFWIEAKTGPITLVIDSHDQINLNASSGTPFTVLPGWNVFITTDAATSGNWYVEGVPARWKLQQATTFYTGYPGGSDTNNNGLSTGSSFATIQHGIDYICNNVDINRQNVILQVADGTYNESLHLYTVTGWGTIGSHSELVIQGNVATPANCVISVGNSNCFSMVGLTTPWRINGFRMTVTSGVGNCVSCDGGSFVYIGKNEFGGVPNAHLSVSYKSFLEAVDNYSIVGNAGNHVNANVSSLADIVGVQITFVGGGITFSAGFVVAAELSDATFQLTSFVGTFTGVRYNAILNAVINTGTGNVNFFPGTIAGSTASGGQYG